MTNVSKHRRRQPRGIPTGGEFASETGRMDAGDLEETSLASSPFVGDIMERMRPASPGESDDRELAVAWRRFDPDWEDGDYESSRDASAFGRTLSRPLHLDDPDGMARRALAVRIEACALHPASELERYGLDEPGPLTVDQCAAILADAGEYGLRYEKYDPSTLEAARKRLNPSPMGETASVHRLPGSLDPIRSVKGGDRAWMMNDMMDDLKRMAPRLDAESARAWADLVADGDWRGVAAWRGDVAIALMRSPMLTGEDARRVVDAVLPHIRGARDRLMLEKAYENRAV